MSEFRRWLTTLRDRRYTPLFSTNGLIADVHDRIAGGRRLTRARVMEQAIIDLVEQGMKDPAWRGVLYVMAWGTEKDLRPLYVGKAGRFGRDGHRLSANLAGIAKSRNKFARWGDARPYHIGGLSQALFKWKAYADVDQKYSAWADLLFLRTEPPTLREPTSLLVGSWYEGDRGPDGRPCTLEEAEEQAIALALEEFEDIVLNVAGEVWWAPAASTRIKKQDPTRPANPIRYVRTSDQLGVAVEALARADIIGLDVETTLYSQKLCLIQCATRSETFIMDVVALQDVSALRGVLGAGAPKVIHNASFERRILSEHGIKVEPVFDTLRASRAHGAASGGHRLAEVVRRQLGRELDKSQQVSDWSRRPLAPAQIEYAALDAEVLVPLYDALAPPLLR